MIARWLLIGLLAVSLQAHKASDSYLSLRLDHRGLTGQLDLAVRDLEHVIGLDANDDGVVTWGELRSRFPTIDSYILARLRVTGDDAPARLRVTEHLVDYHTDGAYAVVRFAADRVETPRLLAVDYRLFFDADPQHRGLLRLEWPGGTRTGVFSPEHSQASFLSDRPSAWREFAQFIAEGLWHIWQGYDHILFLMALLLPSVLRRQGDTTRAAEGFTPVFHHVIKVVSAFTLAHSLTLSLATLGVVRLPSRLVESAIAASVALAALNNLRSFFHKRAWLVAFAFGLVHGFGFASVLSDLGLASGALARGLVGFNLGVEIGQLALVAAFLPFAYGLRTSWFYRRLAFQGGSVVIMVLASGWLAERAFDVKLLPF